jgi:hypothetical protein
MGTDLEVKVLWEVDRNDRSEAQGDERERVAERSVERDLRGDEQKSDMRRGRQGRAGKKPQSSRDQRVRLRKSGARAGTVSVITWGDLALRLKGRRCRTRCVVFRSEKSAEAIVAKDFGESGPLLKQRAEQRGERINRESWKGHASDVHRSDGATAGGRG